jgi:hypothetical protein
VFEEDMAEIPAHLQALLAKQPFMPKKPALSQEFVGVTALSAKMQACLLPNRKQKTPRRNPSSRQGAFLLLQ